MPPDLPAASRVICLSGPLAAGKTTLGMLLSEHGFSHLSTRALIQDVCLAGGNPSRSNLQEAGLQIHDQYGQDWLYDRLLADRVVGEALIVDSMRFKEDHEILRARFGERFLHVHVDAALERRRDRYVLRGGTEREFSLGQDHRVEQDVQILARLADHRISNDTSLEELRVAAARLIGAPDRPTAP